MKSSTTHRNYKVVYDPELDVSPIKQSNIPILQHEKIIEGRTKDPRLLNRDLKSRLYNASFHVLSFEEKMESTVLISNIAPLSTESQIITVLSVYGKVNRVEIIKDNQTGGPLGYAKVTFNTLESAKNAVKIGNKRRVAISDSIKIEFDLSGEKLKAALSPVEKIPDTNSGQQVVEEGEVHSSDEYSPLYERRISFKATTNDESAIRKKPSRWGRPISTNTTVHRPNLIYQEQKDNPPRLSCSSSSLDQKNYTKAMISRESLPFIRGVVEELERVYHPFGCVDIYHDVYNWFIIFNSDTAAIQAQKFTLEKNQRILGYPIELSIPSLSNDNTVMNTSLPSLQSIDISSTAKKMLYGELVDIFLKDIKTRIAGPCIYDFLTPQFSTTKKTDIEQQSKITAAAALESDIVAHAIQLRYEPTEEIQHDSIYKLPRFKKKSISQRSFEENSRKSFSPSPPPQLLQQSPKKIIFQEKEDVDINNGPKPSQPSETINHKDNNNNNSSSSDDDEHFLTTLSNIKKKQQEQKKNISVAPKKKLSQRTGQSDTDEASGSDHENKIKRKSSSKPPVLKKRKTSLQRRPSITKKRKSFSTHNNMVIEEKTPSTCMTTTHSLINSPSNMDVDVDGVDSDTDKKEDLIRSVMRKRREDEEKNSTANRSLEFDQETLEKILQDVDIIDKEEEEWYKDEPMAELNKEWDPFCQTRDVEDLEYLRVALIEKVDPNSNSGHTALEKLQRNEMRTSQSARTRGYYPIPDSVKATYLPKNKAVFEPAAVNIVNGKGGAITSRSKNRVNKRRLMVSMVMQNKGMTDSDILKFNQLKNRKKQLKFQKSPIHEWGLYAEEPIEANDLVIEYVGEVIRQQVAEEREREYERCGIGSSYLFRIDDDTVIDATKKGSIARFINHCCSPNCSAKIITVDKQKKIVICANRDIEPGEEITYDYKFPVEADKIPCLCGSKFCKGTLN